MRATMQHPSRLFWAFVAALWLAVVLSLAARTPLFDGPENRSNPRGAAVTSPREGDPPAAPTPERERGIRPPWHPSWIPELRRQPGRPTPCATA